MKLNKKSLPLLPDNINKPKYDRENTKIGIVHIGPGAFFRAHQAWYTEQAMNAAGGNWAISAVALNSNNVKSKLASQNGLYTLITLDDVEDISIIGAVKEFLTYHNDFEKVLTRLCAVDTKLVNLTITEKGYNLDENGQLSIESNIIKNDLATPEKPMSAVGLLVLTCKIRRDKKRPPLTIISCDNLSDNGKKLKQSLIKYAMYISESLAQYINEYVIFPCTMVDSITPATTDEIVSDIEEKHHYQDNWPIKREAFTQWVIEDILPSDIPAWQHVGVVFTNDIEGYEKAKLRVLNATHSTLAYLGCLLNIETVYDAINILPLELFIKKMLLGEIKPSFKAPETMDFDQYCSNIIQRYHNPKIKHLLAQIAWDGSQKLPMRLLPIISENMVNNHPIKSCCISVAAWMRFIVEKSINQQAVIDPIKDQLIVIGKACTNNPSQDINQFMILDMFKDLKNHQRFLDELTEGYNFLCLHKKTDILALLSGYE